jgi:hypothetical protein
MDYFEGMALQSFQLRLCCGQFRFGQHLWRPQDARRFPMDGPPYGNEIPLRSGVGQGLGHVVRVARLIKANVPDYVIRVPEIDEHEPAFSHAQPPASTFRIVEKLGHRLVRPLVTRHPLPRVVHRLADPFGVSEVARERG